LSHWVRPNFASVVKIADPGQKTKNKQNKKTSKNGHVVRMLDKEAVTSTVPYTVLSIHHIFSLLWLLTAYV
jgi:hypothetical protein